MNSCDLLVLLVFAPADLNCIHLSCFHVLFPKGILDADNSLTERSEEFFSELRNFRQVNKEECVHSQSAGSGRLS